MKVLVIQTQALVPIGSLGQPLLDAGLDLVYWHTDQDQAPSSLEDVAGVVALGGGANPDQDDLYPWLADERIVLSEAVGQRIPTIGLCLGAELLAQVLGAKVKRLDRTAIGWHELAFDAGAKANPVTADFADQLSVFQWHTYSFGLPAGGRLVAGTSETAEAFCWNDAAWAFQFHLEADAKIIGDWVDEYRDVLVDRGLDPTELLAETATRGSGYVLQAQRVGRAFADLVYARSGVSRPTDLGSD